MEDFFRTLGLHLPERGLILQTRINYHFTADMDLEFTCGTRHNSFYFFTNENKNENEEPIMEEMGKLIKEMLCSKRKTLRLKIKDWFRAYVNYGLSGNIKGEIRPFSCGAATERVFLDPYGKILACNGSEEPWIMGDLKESDFDQICNSEQAGKIREMAGKCNRNCWMQHIVAPAIRNKIWFPVFWIIKNKLIFTRKTFMNGSNNLRTNQVTTLTTKAFTEPYKY